MASFYDEWLTAGKDAEAEVQKAPVAARGHDLRWIETPQDARVAMLIGRQVGFPTQGGSLLKAEIPAGWHTGKHRHGEEAIHVLAGSGFAIVEGRRFDWKPGTTFHIPYMAEHQFFNLAPEPALYLSAMSLDLDLFVKLGRLEQLEVKGPNPPNVRDLFPAEASQFAEDGRRIALHLEDAQDENVTGPVSGGHDRVGQQAHRHGAIWVIMGGNESPTDAANGFLARSVAMTEIFEEVARTSSHKHAHTEALLYVLEGSGYSEVDGKRYDWEAGDAVHVPPKMTVHEHFNNSDARTRTLRIEFGIRFFYEALWDGYAKVEYRRHSQKLPAEAGAGHWAHG
jgi:quercetin dioxygenase-like cupin family protein